MVFLKEASIRWFSFILHLIFGVGGSLPMVGAKSGEGCKLLNICLVQKLMG
ncbi:MAG: hypothetical protein ACI9N9_000149 [Enterobacterales bacterium]|jgi:hypothetical protein